MVAIRCHDALSERGSETFTNVPAFCKDMAGLEMNRAPVYKNFQIRRRPGNGPSHYHYRPEEQPDFLTEELARSRLHGLGYRSHPPCQIPG